MKNSKGVIVKFELLDEDDNVMDVIAERSFPNAVFSSWNDSWNPRLTHQCCFDKEVGKYVHEQHLVNDVKYDYCNWEEAPNIRQAFYDINNKLVYSVDEVEYAMNL